MSADPSPEAEARYLLPIVLLAVLALFAVLIFAQDDGRHSSIPPAPTQAEAALLDGALVPARSLASWFTTHGYELSDVRDGEATPNFALTRLPRDMRSLTQVDRRKRLFLRIVLPLVLMTNDEISEERTRLLELSESYKAGGWTEDQLASFEFLADKYGVDDVSVELTDRLDILLSRVDVIPVDLALAQAAEESAWGMSRFARDGNALFGQWTWNEKAGLIPQEQRPGQTYAVRAFRSLLDSVRAYAFNLNTHWAYADFRAQRADGVKTGNALAGTLLMYSERREAYVQSLRALMRVNSLQGLAGARLDPNKLLGDIDPLLAQG